MVTYRRAYAQKRLAGVQDPLEEDGILNFFETVALLTNHGYLSEADVYETFGQDIFPLYKDCRDWIEQDRKQDEAEYSNLVWLIPRLEQIDKERHGTSANPSQDDIKGFWEATTEAGVGTPIARKKPRHPNVAK